MKKHLQTLICCLGLMLITSACTKEDLPVADFTFTVSGKTVQFTDASTNAKTYYWDFANGTSIKLEDRVSDKQSPSYTYAASGTYSVVLKVLNLDVTTQASYKTATVIVP